MAGQYIGVSGVARKVTNNYIGVDGVARKIARGYIGVDGVARSFWDAKPHVIGTLYLRPSADISVEHSLYPSESTVAYTLINEEVADDNSTYIQNGSGGITGLTLTSAFSMECAAAAHICSVSAASLTVRSCYSGYSANQTYKIMVDDVEVESISVDLSSVSYTTYTFDLSNISGAINDYISSNGTFPPVSFSLTDRAEDDGTAKASSYTYITQVYVELTCEYIAQ